MNRRDFLRGGALGAAAAVATASPFVQRLLTKITSLWGRGGAGGASWVSLRGSSGVLPGMWRKVQSDVVKGFAFESPEYDSILLDEWEGDPSLYWSTGIELDARYSHEASAVVPFDLAPRDPVRSSIDRHARKLDRQMSAALRRHTAALERHVNEMYYGRSA